eukprot:gb/GECG01005412.1/.p1 GENE.gb/GECG01005412.1/~~gb/GECG01005412.1/.p1  ORF type:complete len:131 (+),score=11.24 gb/GECG01005412.1/:1-393(+)
MVFRILFDLLKGPKQQWILLEIGEGSLKAGIGIELNNRQRSSENTQSKSLSKPVYIKHLAYRCFAFGLNCATHQVPETFSKWALSLLSVCNAKINEISFGFSQFPRSTTSRLRECGTEKRHFELRFPLLY